RRHRQLEFTFLWTRNRIAARSTDSAIDAVRILGGAVMKRIGAMFLLVVIFCVSSANGQGVGPLKLAQTIPMPGVEGRIDHLSVDLKGQRLFVAALGNNTLEVIDLAQGKRLRSIPGLREPQGVVYIPELDQVVVANGDDGTVRTFDGKSFMM